MEQTETKEVSSKNTTNKIAEIVYFLGGLIVVVGIVFLVGQHWGELSGFVKILVSLGVALAAYILAFLCDLNHIPMRFHKLSNVFYVIAGLLLPVGLFVTFSVAHLDVTSLAMTTMMTLLLAAAFVVPAVYFKRTTLWFFAIVFSTAFFFALTQHLDFFDYQYTLYRFLIVGLVYGFLAYAIRNSEVKRLVGPLYTFGSAFFLGSALILGGLDVIPQTHNVVWELLFPLCGLGVIFWGAHMHSWSLRVVGVIFVMLYLVKLSFQYFAASMGWPIALIVMGILLVALGFVVVKISTKPAEEKEAIE